MKTNNLKFNIENKNALITGAGGVLGPQHCKALLEIGGNVVLTDIDKNNLLSSKEFLLQEGFNESRIYSYEMDVGDENNIKDISSKLKKLNININILVNNAAINPSTPSIIDNIRTTRLENFSIDRWNQELLVGLTGSYLCGKVFGSEMAKNGTGGVILNIASDLSVIAPDQRLYHQKNTPDELQAVKPITYSVIKHGLIGLTKYLASYWPDKGIRANALSPGGIYINQDEEFVLRLNELIPLGRMAQPDEYISAVQFLCSEASAYMNGQNIVIDGGRSII